MTTNRPSTKSEELRPAISFVSFVSVLLAVAAGTLVAVWAIPAWVPSLTSSLQGNAPKAFWYLSRASAWMAYLLMWLSMVMGILLTNRMARVWPGGPTAFDLHQYASLLGLNLGLFHALVLMGDRYVNASLTQVLVPFAYTGYRPLWVGIGQLSFYALIVISLTFYVRGLIGMRAWRFIHLLSFIAFVVTLAHGLLSGTDSASLWAQGAYWATGGSVLFLTLYRVLVAVFKPMRLPTESKAIS
jgi:predicted ferric reductase